MISQLLLTLVAVFLSETFLYFIKPDLPKLPGDIYINKFGFSLYIPFVSSIVLSIGLTLLLNFLKLPKT